MNTVLNFLFPTAGIIFSLPTILFIPVTAILAVFGYIKKDYTYLKKYFKVWMFSMLGMIVLVMLFLAVRVISYMF